ncbi:SPOSA6832_02642, partial [Sporobolomyces salmonicolor]
MGIGAKNNTSRGPSRPPGQQPSAPPAGSSHSNAPFPQRGATGQPTKGQQTNDRLYLCLPFVKAALVKGNFKTIVALPKYVDVNEWVAVNLVDLFNNLNLFYSVVTEFCTVENNPTMSAGPGQVLRRAHVPRRLPLQFAHLVCLFPSRRMDYTWIDASRKRVKLPAPQYIDYVLTWVEGLIKDEAVFPTKAGREFSPNFPSVARHIYTQLLRIFAHLYHAHYPIYLHLSAEGHLNSLFAHFLTFGREFDLLEPKECRAPKEGWPFVIGDLMDVSAVSERCTGTGPSQPVGAVHSLVTSRLTLAFQAWRGLGILEP